jgi:NAD(P)-dependent dehydrogenase (short-subunit alcohol dehydrogenase family)
MNENDTVVVIGGSSGLGLAVARRCLADGARVVIAGRSQQRLDAATKELGSPGRLTAVPGGESGSRGISPTPSAS